LNSEVKPKLAGVILGLILRRLDFHPNGVKFEEFPEPRDTDNRKDKVLLDAYLKLILEKELAVFSETDDAFFITHKGRDFIRDSITAKCTKLIG